MIQQPSWAKILQSQMVEKQQFDNQIRDDQQQRKLRYKKELETDMMLHQQRKLVQYNQNEKLDSQMLETLRQRESKKLKEMEERKIKQIETSLENLNRQMIQKKMNKERSYQSQLLDKEYLKQQQLKEMKDIEVQRMRKEEGSKQLREQYDLMIEEKRSLKYQKQPQSLSTLELQQRPKIESIQYQEELNKQLQEKRKQLLDLQVRKQEERIKVEQKIAFEKQKLMENKLKDFQIYKQYETDNYALHKERKKNDQNQSLDLMQRSEQQKLPRIYLDNYQPQERKKQLDLLDQDLQKYQRMQEQHMQPPPPKKSQTPLKTPLSDQSKKSKPIKSVQDHGYSQIHQSKTSTPKSQTKVSGRTPVEINEKILNQRYVPKKRSFNIVTGQ